MLTIGDFARYGRVSVRMLRHYDAIGLLQPARVDPATGYRSYEAHQLSRLNRIVALKDLGFTLQQVGAILDEKVSLEELRGMLRLRQTELNAEIAAGAGRLARVEARLQLIEAEGTLGVDEVQLKPIPGVRVAELTGRAVSFEPDAIAPVLEPLYDELRERLARQGQRPVGPDIAYYEDAGEGSDGLIVHAGISVAAGTRAEPGYAVVDLPPIAEAATIVHRGPMTAVMSTIQALARWVEVNGLRSVGYNRELYLQIGADRAAWVTELQVPVAPRRKGSDTCMGH